MVAISVSSNSVMPLFAGAAFAPLAGAGSGATRQYKRMTEAADNWDAAARSHETARIMNSKFIPEVSMSMTPVPVAKEAPMALSGNVPHVRAVDLKPVVRLSWALSKN